MRSVDLEARIFENRLSIEILSASMPELKMKNGQIKMERTNNDAVRVQDKDLI